mmetsp:Transcript_21089/g.59893  ORF Transcript_21089/g.59893 Transcript_21089/m.59893 type:complete len:248 (-) Transcript_21089:47-790(-)
MSDASWCGTRNQPLGVSSIAAFLRVKLPAASSKKCTISWRAAEKDRHRLDAAWNDAFTLSVMLNAFSGSWSNSDDVAVTDESAAWTISSASPTRDSTKSLSSCVTLRPGTLTLKASASNAATPALMLPAVSFTLAAYASTEACTLPTVPLTASPAVERADPTTSFAFAVASSTAPVMTLRASFPKPKSGNSARAARTTRCCSSAASSKAQPSEASKPPGERSGEDAAATQAERRSMARMATAGMGRC